MFLHDSGKPHCKTTDGNGVDHFYSHGKISKKIAFDMLTRLKTSNKFRDTVCSFVEDHDFLPDKISKKTYKKYIAKLGIETVENLFHIREADVLAQSPEFHKESLSQNETGKKILEEIKNEENCFKISDLAVDGRKLENIGIAPSPAMGRIMKKLLDEVMDEKLPNDEGELIERAKQLAGL